MTHDTPRRVSLADVARLAGVSTNTVSRVVRGDPEVADKTRTRISALLDEVGYRPNYAARALAGRRTGVVHVVQAAPMFHGHGSVLLSVLDAASLAGYHVSMSSVYHNGQLTTRVGDIAPFHVDGAIILGGQEPTIELALEIGARVPTVLLLTGEHDLDGVSTVSVNSRKGSRLATEHLLRQGLTDIVHVAGPWKWSDAERRREGFVEACEDAGVAPRLLSAGSWEARDGFDIVRTMDTLPQGFVCANDQLALGTMRAVQERGSRIPDDVCVVGFDGIDGTDCYMPPLSTVRQPFDRVGRTAVRQLDTLMSGGAHQDIEIEPELVIRASSLI